MIIVITKMTDNVTLLYIFIISLPLLKDIAVHHYLIHVAHNYLNLHLPLAKVTNKKITTTRMTTTIGNQCF